jgi:4-amino-4-deoxy-L-arabinose transferase-like glycosyltransferase
MELIPHLVPARDPSDARGLASTRASRWPLVPLAIAAVAAALRFAWLGQHSIWADEAFVASAIRLNWADLFGFLARADAHPPLYYALMKGWASVAGSGEAALRAPSACASSVSVLLTYELARRVSSESVSRIGALLVALSPFDIMAGQQARMYPLLSALAVGATIALAHSVEGDSRTRWGTYVLLATLTIYTHYLGFLVLAAHGVWVAMWARRRVTVWLGAMAAAEVLYLPWSVALMTRAADVVQVGRTANGIVPYLTPDGLLALLAFGGSLFGTASYWGAGASRVVEHAAVLLPFVVLLGWGIAALWPRRDALMLVALPLIVPVIIATPISLATPLLWPRAFSFVEPFFALLLAQGIAAAAQVAGHRRDPALVLLLTGVLAFSAPVLAQHYVDPSARPYHWRAAAAWVAGEAKPGDYFVYVGKATEDSFTYYYRPPSPSRTLQLRRDPRPTFTRDTVQRLARQYRRVWLILSTPFGPTHAVVRRQLLPALSGAFRVTGSREFNQVWVYLLEPSGHPAR